MKTESTYARGQGGWSIIELLATCSVLATVSVTLLPSLADMRQAYELRAATRRVYAELQSLRAAAVTSNARQRLSAGPDGGLRFEHFDLETGQWIDSGVVARELADVQVNLSGEIVFAPDGTAPSSGTVAIYDGHGQGKNVVVSTAGVVRVDTSAAAVVATY
jgi:Tfp pilus assembly protein FimT